MRLLGPLRMLFGVNELNLPSAPQRVRELRGLLAGHVEEGHRIALNPGAVLVLVNGREIATLAGEETVVKPEDMIVLVPVAHGGRIGTHDNPPR